MSTMLFINIKHIISCPPLVVSVKLILECLFTFSNEIYIFNDYLIELL